MTQGTKHIRGTIEYFHPTIRHPLTYLRPFMDDKDKLDKKDSMQKHMSFSILMSTQPWLDRQMTPETTMVRSNPS